MRLKTINEAVESEEKDQDLKKLLETEPQQSFIDWVTKTAEEEKIDLDNIDMKQLAAGIEVEREHDGNDDVDVVKSNEDLLKIAVAHLREKKTYYTVLLAAGL